MQVAELEEEEEEEEVEEKNTVDQVVHTADDLPFTVL